MSESAPLTVQTIEERGFEWLLKSSFLARLPRRELDAVLAEMRWRDHARGDIVIQADVPAPGVTLIVAGRAVVAAPDGQGGWDAIARLAAGHVVGERSTLLGERTNARVEALTSLRSLHVPAAAFHSLLERFTDLRKYIEELVALRERSERILSLLLRDDVLRVLGRDDLERLVQSAALVRVQGDDMVVRLGELDSDVYMVVGGKVAVFVPAHDGSRQRVGTHGAGYMFGHAAALLETPRTADVQALERSELLRIPEKNFMHLVARNPPLQRRLYQELADLDLSTVEALRAADRRPVHVICGQERGRGATTIAYAVSAELDALGCSVTLIDPRGDDTASRLGMTVRTGQSLGIPVHRLEAPEHWGVEVLWPADPARFLDLIAEHASRSSKRGPVVVAGVHSHENHADLIRHATGVIVVRNADDPAQELVHDETGHVVEAVRIIHGAELPMATSQNVVRVPDDPRTASRFWRTGDLESLRDPRRRLGRAAARLVRSLEGRAVGIALGGGGALGFAHIGLIQAMTEAGIPIDHVAGVSFGSVIGAVYCGGGLEALHELRRQKNRLNVYINTCFASVRPLTGFIERLTGGQRLESTDIPFYPVSLDVWTGREVVISRGTLAEGMRASSSFPGMFPAFRRGVHRLVDGGIINNVPASVVWDAGAGFIVASNIIPPFPVGRDPVLGSGLRARVEAATVSRVDDLIRSVFLLMSQTGRDRATLADYVFDFDVTGYTVTDVPKGDEIYRAGLDQARREMADILRTQATDRSALRRR